MKISGKRKAIGIGSILTIVIVALFAMWAINKYQNDKLLNDGEAQLFDKCMEASYPLLSNYSNVLYEKASMFEQNAQQASAYSRDMDEFQEILVNLNRPYINSRKDWFAIEMEYRMFITSVPYGYLCIYPKYRKNEACAFGKILYAENKLKRWDEMEPDSLIRACKEIKVDLSEAIRDLDKYRKPYQEITAWREISPNDVADFYKEYNERKNWPFTFLNK